MPAKQSKNRIMKGVGVLLILAAFGLGYARMHLYPFAIKPEVKLIVDSRLSHLIALDHPGFLADMLFIQVNLHSGSMMWKPNFIDFDSQWAYRIMDVITDLDPKFFTAYLFSAMGLVHYHDDVKLAEPILKKGMKVFPDAWELPFWAGFGYYNRQGDFETASKYMWEAYNKPDAPRQFLGLMVSAMQRSGNFHQAAMAMKAMMDHTDNPNLKTLYAKKAVRMKNLAVMMKAATAYKEQTGSFPDSLDDLVGARLLNQIPKDPDGLSYQWKKEKNLPGIAR
ncbi:hypothetical protein [Desulfobacula phenolica]|uniref:Tetratricopeptide repeat-containing protein n=1 Tax=Desulfobacula phenolica TaxID=90732 RepID=A0A1H2IYN6_9BACT|nr:hypothetical protein [Desulfobacula phenolica]SDU49314.1 hypothetical protein SAMN04487931_11022 [Desulfobacula phenolica]